jgi:hypothetical protein
MQQLLLTVNFPRLVVFLERPCMTDAAHKNIFFLKHCRYLLGKPEGKRPLGRPRRRLEDGIRMDLREIGLGGGVWIGFDWLRTGTGGGVL